MTPNFEMFNFELKCPVSKTTSFVNDTMENFNKKMNSFIGNTEINRFHNMTSNIDKWLQIVRFSPLIQFLEKFEFQHHYEEVKDAFLNAMFDARWFPYAGYVVDYRIMDKMLDILNTSRARKNRIKRIDKLIFSYYTKNEMENLKHGWRQMKLPAYMTKILIQSVQAYYRKEYALTVSALSTLWEGIIREKMKDAGYRTSQKTRQELVTLVERNEIDKIFSSFGEEFIFYDCHKPEEVKPDVPGRHSIAHGWYNTYPSRKMALNAILFTDFLLRLKNVDKLEDEING